MKDIVEEEFNQKEQIKHERNWIWNKFCDYGFPSCFFIFLLQGSLLYSLSECQRNSEEKIPSQ